MHSFKGFMQLNLVQFGVAPLDVFQRKYDEYRLEYCEKLSSTFFSDNKYEEWFRERYDPSVQLELEAESKRWGAVESKRFFDLVAAEHRDNSGEVVSCRLGVGNVGSAQGTASFHHFVGHLGHTVYMSGIPANCSRSCLLLAVSELIHSEIKTEKSAVDRLVMSQPTWNTREGRLVFEKCAWLVLTHEIPNITKAAVTLKELQVFLTDPTGD